MDYSSIEQIVRDFQYSYMEHLISSGHNASGNLALSQKYLLDFDGRYFTVTLVLPKYAIYLEKGTKPHFPPIEAIKKWIQIKPILPRPLPSGKLPTEDQLSYMIANKIAKVGTPATNVLKNTIKDFGLTQKVLDAFIVEWKKELEKVYL